MKRFQLALSVAIALLPMAASAQAPYGITWDLQATTANGMTSDTAGVCIANGNVFDSTGVMACYPSADTVPPATVYKSHSAWPAATVNTTGSDLVLAPGQGSTRITVATNANCGAGDTVTVTVNGTANVLTRGTQWTEGATGALTCASVRTAVVALTGIDTTLTACNGAGLDIYRNASGYDLNVATNDATCFTVANGTDGVAKVYGDLSLASSAGVFTTGTVVANNQILSAGLVRGATFRSTNADTADAGQIQLGNAETICAEASPASTDGCMLFNSSEYWSLTGSNGFQLTASNWLAMGNIASATTHSIFGYYATQTPDTTVLLLGQEGRSLIIGENGDFGDYAYPQQTNPTIVVQSADATNPTQRITMTHDQTNGVITAGAGAVSIQPSVLTPKIQTTGSAFAALATPADGTMQYCSDCTRTVPGAACAGSGGGALAVRIASAWYCF